MKRTLFSLIAFISMSANLSADEVPAGSDWTEVETSLYILFIEPVFSFLTPVAKSAGAILEPKVTANVIGWKVYGGNNEASANTAVELPNAK